MDFTVSGQGRERNHLVEEMRHVQELRLEANLRRMKLSDAATELMKYCESHKSEDFLLPTGRSKKNPYEEKKKCSLL
eukprot:gene20644-22680_t